jgi:hypothetical protein
MLSCGNGIVAEIGTGAEFVIGLHSTDCALPETSLGIDLAGHTNNC